jgi:FkbM family methyltransferase
MAKSGGLRARLTSAAKALLGPRTLAWLRERRMLDDARRCPPSTDPLVEETIALWVRPGMVVVDAGAHQGLWTFRLARAVGPTGHVFAIEPSPEYAPGLARVVTRAGLSNVTMLTLALGDREGTMRFCTRTADGSRLTGESRLSTDGVEGDTEVRVATLDSLVGDHPRLAEIGFLKVDVEGAELLLFRGADGLLRSRHPHIYAEIEDRHCNRFGWTRETVLDHLTSLGYAAESVNPWDFRLSAHSDPSSASRVLR